MKIENMEDFFIASTKDYKLGIFNMICYMTSSIVQTPGGSPWRKMTRCVCQIKFHNAVIEF